MKKNYCSVITLSTLMFFASCSNSTKTTDQGVQKVDSLPRNPTSGQVYHDSNGHSWVYDMAAGMWIMNMINGSGRTITYHYYPSAGYYTDGAGKTITPPTSVSSGISDGVKARTQTVTKQKVNLDKSSSNSSSSTIKKNTTTTKKSTGKSVFGRTGRSSSISS